MMHLTRLLLNSTTINYSPHHITHLILMPRNGSLTPKDVNNWCRYYSSVSYDGGSYTVILFNCIIYCFVVVVFYDKIICFYWLYTLKFPCCFYLLQDAHLHQAKGLLIKICHSTNAGEFTFAKMLINVHCPFSKIKNWIEKQENLLFAIQ